MKAVTYTTTTTTTTAVTINGVRTLELGGPWMTVLGQGSSFMTLCKAAPGFPTPSGPCGCCHAKMLQFSGVFVSVPLRLGQRSSTGRRLHSRRFDRRARLLRFKWALG